jgi:hypothetical protein
MSVISCAELAIHFFLLSGEGFSPSGTKFADRTTGAHDRHDVDAGPEPVSVPLLQLAQHPDGVPQTAPFVVLLTSASATLTAPFPPHPQLPRRPPSRLPRQAFHRDEHRRDARQGRARHAHLPAPGDPHVKKKRETEEGWKRPSSAKGGHVNRPRCFIRKVGRSGRGKMRLCCIWAFRAC